MHRRSNTIWVTHPIQRHRRPTSYECASASCRAPVSSACGSHAHAGGGRGQGQRQQGRHTRAAAAAAAAAAAVSLPLQPPQMPPSYTSVGSCWFKVGLLPVPPPPNMCPPSHPNQQQLGTITTQYLHECSIPSYTTYCLANSFKPHISCLGLAPAHPWTMIA